MYGNTDFDRQRPGARRITGQNIAHAAATATEDILKFVIPYNCKLRAWYVAPLTAVTGADTNTTNLNLVNRGTGAGTTEVANHDLVLGTNLAAGNNALDADLDVSLNEGDVVAVQAEKVGTGGSTALPAGTFTLVIEGR